MHTRQFFNPDVQQTKVTEALSTAQAVVDAAPMFCVLYLATRERAIQLAGLEPTTPVPALLELEEVVNLPQDWVRIAMIVSAVCLGISALITTPAKEMYKPDDASSAQQKNTLVDLLHNLALATRYISIIAVLVGLLTMSVPGQDGPALTDSACCVVSLVVQYFVIFTLWEASRAWDTMNYAPGQTGRLQGILELAKKTVNYAPMLCVLFMVARMRADIVTGGVLPDFAIRSFYICTYVLLAQTLFAIILPYALVGVSTKPGDMPGDIKYTGDNQSSLGIISLARWACIIALHIGMITILVSIFTIEAPSGKTPALSATARCVTGLTSMYFLLYVIYSALLSIKEFGDPKSVKEIQGTVSIFEDTLVTVKFVPMLCVLFIGTRLRALQMTAYKGSPQGWVQDCMSLCVWATYVQALFFLLIGFWQGKAPSARPESRQEAQNDSCGMFTTFIQYFCMLLLYGAVIGVIVGVFQMTPANANGKGNLIDGVSIPSCVPTFGSAGGTI